ncbi:hypothetical protein [Patulibacter sp.]|uniref:hypothetical protein n=1 Tax=Patulibacter sp. TaxID=1912859 RepID=UPI0027291A63|nr:hypothetical protein [Patulibacter sp.]MDO9410255.1 hypothetical protein [Patulibacter sp.]
MTLLATTGAATYTIWLILLWAVIIPAFAIIPVMYALAQVAGERKENLEFERGVRPEDPDKVVVEA